MACRGCVDVRVIVSDREGGLLATLTGFLANGGSLSLSRPINLAPGDSIRIEKPDGSEAWSVKSISASSGKTNRRYKYSVHMTPIPIQ
jgi:hypothetical protein